MITNQQIENRASNASNHVNTDLQNEGILKAVAGQEINAYLHLARVKPWVRSILQQDGVIDIIGADHIHENVASAVTMHLEKFPITFANCETPKLNQL